MNMPQSFAVAKTEVRLSYYFEYLLLIFEYLDYCF